MLLSILVVFPKKSFCLCFWIFLAAPVSVRSCATSLRVRCRVGKFFPVRTPILRDILVLFAFVLVAKLWPQFFPRAPFLRASIILEIACVTNQLLIHKYLGHYDMLLSIFFVCPKKTLRFMFLGFLCRSCKHAPLRFLHLPYHCGGMGTPPAFFRSVIAVCHWFSQRDRAWMVRK